MYLKSHELCMCLLLACVCALRPTGRVGTSQLGATGTRGGGGECSVVFLLSVVGPSEEVARHMSVVPVSHDLWCQCHMTCDAKVVG